MIFDFYNQLKITNGRRYFMDIIRRLQNSEYFIEPFPKDTMVTMAYVPFQNAGELYAPEQALCRGTLFPELDKPFEPGQRNGGNCND